MYEGSGTLRQFSLAGTEVVRGDKFANAGKFNVQETGPSKWQDSIDATHKTIKLSVLSTMQLTASPEPENESHCERTFGNVSFSRVRYVTYTLHYFSS